MGNNLKKISKIKMVDAKPISKPANFAAYEGKI